MFTLHIAAEYERGLYDPRFMVANVAPSILAHPTNLDPKSGKTAVFHKEGTRHQLEYNSRDTDQLSILIQEFLEAEKKLKDLQRITGLDDIVCIPTSENGAGEGIFNTDLQHRRAIYEGIFGSAKMDRLLRISGIHYHIDICSRRTVQQFNGLTGLQPTISLMSTSPLGPEGQNELNCHRYNAFANRFTGVFAEIPEKSTYIKSIGDLYRNMAERYALWLDRWVELDNDPAIFQRNFQPHNTGYPDIRFRPDIGRGTFELRQCDSAPMDLLIGHAALLMGYCRIICSGNAEVNIAEQEGDYQFNPHTNRILLPSLPFLDKLTARAIVKGLEDNSVQSYLKQMLDFARKGLEERDTPLLDPLYEMVESGKNIATQTVDHLTQQGYAPTNSIFSLEARQAANRFVWQRDQQGIQRLQQLVG